jgi:repressor LexA
MSGINKAILDFIIAYTQEHCYPPTYREIGDAVGLKSNSTVHTHIKQMLDAGDLETDEEFGKPRAIRVPGYALVPIPERKDGEMSYSEAIRILHPDTTADALAEIEYYAGFKGEDAKVNAVGVACLVACKALKALETAERGSENAVD